MGRWAVKLIPPLFVTAMSFASSLRSHSAITHKIRAFAPQIVASQASYEDFKKEIEKLEPFELIITNQVDGVIEKRRTRVEEERFETLKKQLVALEWIRSELKSKIADAYHDFSADILASAIGDFLDLINQSLKREVKEIDLARAEMLYMRLRVLDEAFREKQSRDPGWNQVSLARDILKALAIDFTDSKAKELEDRIFPKITVSTSLGTFYISREELKEKIKDTVTEKVGTETDFRLNRRKVTKSTNDKWLATQRQKYLTKEKEVLTQIVSYLRMGAYQDRTVVSAD